MTPKLSTRHQAHRMIKSRGGKLREPTGHPDILLCRVEPNSLSGTLSAFAVYRRGQRLPVGFLWRSQTLSYRGSQGWNRGIRLKDFHPKNWYGGPAIHEDVTGPCPTRKRALARLLERLKEH